MDKFKRQRNSLVVQWLGLGAFTAGVWVQSPIRELRFHKQATSKKNIYIYIKRQRVDWEEVFTIFNTEKFKY